MLVQERRQRRRADKRSIVMFSVIAVLLASLIGTVFWAFSLKNEVKESKNNYSSVLKSNDSLKQQLASEKSVNSAVRQEKDSVEKDNESLKKQIAEMAERKKSEAASAVSNSLPLNYGSPSKGACYLTFDDGPSPNTLRILNTLKEKNVKATFFVTGNGPTSYIKNIYQDGHTVGLHTNSHNYAAIYSGTEAYLSDLNAISDKVFSVTGHRSKIIRFPGGSSNTVSKKYCKGIMTALSSRVTEMGYSYFDWNISSGDANSKSLPAATIVSNILNQAKDKNSICVLMHDSAAQNTTADALSAVIDGLSKMGFHFEAITDKTYGYHHGINN